VTTLDPDAHDEIVAHISHLPQVIAATLSDFLSRRTPPGATSPAAACATPPASPAATHDVDGHSPAQPEEILRALRQFQDELHGFQTALANRDFAELRTRLERGKSYRDDFPP